MAKLSALLVVLAALIVVSSSSAATTWTVTKTADTNDGTCNGDCSLREAVNAAGNGDTIVIPASASPYAVTGSALVFSVNVTVVGSSARGTVLQGSPGNRVMRITAGTTTMSGVTITGGDLTVSNFDGGGIDVQAGAINLTDSAILGNKVETSSGNAAGGGLALEPGTSATLTRVTVAGNSVTSTATSGSSTFGGGLSNTSGTLTIVDSTITGNSTLNASSGLRARGGGFEQSGASPTTSFDNSTVAGNTSGGAALGFGGNLEAQSGTVTLKNSILTSGSTDFGPNCFSEGTGTFTSSGGNVKDLPEGSNDQCGFGASDRAGADPRLSSLGNFGGPTDTMALLAGSAALDFAGSCGIATDQRGVARPQGAACDSGAYEAQIPAARASADRATAATGQTVNFDGSTSSGDSLSFVWNFGDGATATGPTAAHAFSSSGHHVVTLTVTDIRGATSSATVSVDVPDVTKPTLSALALKPSAFRAAPSGPSARAGKRTTGARVTFRLSETATVRFSVERARPGRRSGKKCVAPKARNRHARACTRYVKVRGSFSRSGTPGSNHFRFTGRVGGKRLTPGGYRLVAVPKDPAGNVGKAQRRAFRIVR